MNVLLLNASPKRITSASKYFLGLLGLHLRGCKQIKLHLSGSAMFTKVFDSFSDIDVLVIALPVYVDGVPASVLRFLEESEQFINENNCRFKLYVISNCGFYEGTQCKHLLNIMQNFCVKTGLTWGGGIGIGAGEMLSVLRIMPLFTLLTLIFSVPPVLIAGASFLGAIITAAVLFSVFLLLSSRLFLSVKKLGKAIRHSAITQNFYTGLTLCPRFVFIILSNMYFIVRASLLGCGFWEMYKKIARCQT